MARRVAALLACLNLCALNAAAQAAGGEKWDVEFHVGGVLVSTPSDGTGSLPRGTRTTTGVLEMWQVPSWYFGDGAAVLTQYPLPRTTPLDGMLQSLVGRQDPAATFGARIARRLTDRVRAEGDIDVNRGTRKLTSAAEAGLEASRASFISYWRAFPTLSPATVTSAVETHDGDLVDVLTTGVLTWDIGSIGPLTPYVLGGAGVRWSSGDGPSVDVTGSYTTFLFNIRDTDALRIRHVQSPTTAVGVFGAGVRWPLGRRWGIRIDARDHLSGSGVTTELDASPASVQDNLVSIIVVNPAVTTAIRFGNSVVGPPTLSLPVSGAKTFEADGIRHHVNVTAGLTWRF